MSDPESTAGGTGAHGRHPCTGEGRGLVALVALALAVGVLLVTFLLRGIQQVDDSMSYAVAIKTGEHLYHPHHLLFGPIVRLLWLPLAGHVGAIGASQVHNALWGAATLIATCAVLRRATGSLALGGAAASLLFACFGFLTYCVQVEVYVPAAGCFTLAVWVLVARIEGVSQPRARDLALVAGLLSFAIFYHQPNVLLCLPLVAFFATCPGPAGRAVALRRAALVIAAAGGLVFSTYVAAYAAEDGPASPAGFVDHVLRYALAVEVERDWGTFANVSLRGLGQMVGSQLVGIVPPDQAGSAVLRWALALVVVSLSVWNAVQVRRGAASRGLRTLALTWLLVNYAFFLWWQPFQLEFFIAPLVPLVTLLGLTLADVAAPGTRRAALACGVLALAGFLFARSYRELHGRIGTWGRDTAAEYLAVVPADAFHVGHRNLVQTLRYEFDVGIDQSMNMAQARRFALVGEEVHELFPLPASGVVAAPASEVTPRRKSNEAPADWLRFYEWLFRLSETAGGLRGPEVRAVRAASGPAYLVIGPPDAEFPDAAAFFRSLDRSLAPAVRGRFLPWYEQNRSRLE